MSFDNPSPPRRKNPFVRSAERLASVTEKKLSLYSSTGNDCSFDDALDRSFDMSAMASGGERDCSLSEDDIVKNFDRLQEDYDKLKVENVSLKSDVELIKGLLIRQSKKLLYLEDCLVKVTSHSMKDNIIVNGCPESNQDSETVLRKFIKDNLEIDVPANQVVRAHRLGTPKAPAATPAPVSPRGAPTSPRGAAAAAPAKSTPRPLVAKLDYKVKQEIMKNTNKLIGKKVYVNHQEPEAVVERSKKLRFRLKHMKQLHQGDNAPRPKPEVKIVNGDVFVNHQKISDQIQTPTTQMMLETPLEVRKQLSQMTMVKTGEITDGGSTFFAYGRKVNNWDEVRRGYMKVKMAHPDADDIMCSFSVKDCFGHQRHELHDDREHGGASRILSAIQNAKMTDVAVYVLRYFDGNKIGRKRFTHIYDSATKALELLKKK